MKHLVVSVGRGLLVIWLCETGVSMLVLRVRRSRADHELVGSVLYHYLFSLFYHGSLVRLWSFGEPVAVRNPCAVTQGDGCPALHAACH